MTTTTTAHGVPARGGGAAAAPGDEPAAPPGSRTEGASPQPASPPAGPLDVEAVRSDFPILQQERAGHRLVYLDSASSSQHPRQVLETMDRYYLTTHANVHRGVYAIAEEATREYEEARHHVGRFIGAPKPASEVVFTKNATEALNLVANSYGRRRLPDGKAVVLTEMEHHANLVPWLMLAEERGVELRYLPITDEFQLDLSDLDRLTDGAGIVAVTAMSNVLGTLNDLGPIVEAAHANGAIVVCDASQLVPHRAVDVARLGVDFFAFTGHKMLGPTGVGVLWGREELLEDMPPFLGGGEMIRDVRLDGFTPNELPWKFEAGTQPIAEAIGLGAAVSYLEAVGMDRITEHETQLTAFTFETLRAEHGDDVRFFGPEPDPRLRGGAISIGYRNIHSHDLAQILDAEGICVRAGHHCAKPLMRHLAVPATARASLYLYNDEEDVRALSAGLTKAKEMFG
ncbi:MAG TPA: SufS family cysteine desulfurase [Acidimicrobiales bacterium]|nr:SufS family cysteine desulfurase [Acidimicrobiales bacterium]